MIRALFKADTGTYTHFTSNVYFR